MSQDEFLGALVESARDRKSWRGRLQWIRDRLLEPTFLPTPEHLATIAVYLRFLATGELPCEEDGRHFRPNHHAEAALQIDRTLETLSGPDTGWILRRIYPYLPSWGDEFRRAEPLTRIRDIAHRNDIPPDLKREIKQRLQNKLHRCAGPEDLHTARELLERVTASGAGCSPSFVAEFKVFYGELQEFFNASALDVRLRELARSGERTCAEAISGFLSRKEKGSHSVADSFDLLRLLTDLRRLLAERLGQEGEYRRSQVRLADIGLEDYAFTLLSACANQLGELARPDSWAFLLRGLEAALDNLRLSLIESEECAALGSELAAWARDFRTDDRFHLLRLLATLGRIRRLTEGYADRLGKLFPPGAEELGRALAIPEHAVRVFTEGDLRGHVVFQLSRLVDLGLRAAREALRLPPWEAIVPGQACGRLVRITDWSEVESENGPLLLLLERTDGDAEIPANVKGILLGHPIPLLSHLGVRTRQARIPFASCADREHLQEYAMFVGKVVHLSIREDQVTVQENAHLSAERVPVPVPPVFSVPLASLSTKEDVLPLEQATPASCGAKGMGARQLLELAAQSDGLFRAPRGRVVPFGVMERSLDAVPGIRTEYLALQEKLSRTTPADLEALLERLGELVRTLPVPKEVSEAVTSYLGPGTRLAVRSSANGEDLEHLSGAGLYESIVNVACEEVVKAIPKVWASLWTRRAVVSRTQAGIPHDRIRMAVLLQELVSPDLSFILHTANPLTGNRDEALVELAVGLGEVLASTSVAGTPYRMKCQRATGSVELLTCANFSVALWPTPTGIVSQRLDYSRLALSADPGSAPRLGKRLARLATFLEERLGRPQDVEGVLSGDVVSVVQARPQQGL